MRCHHFSREILREENLIDLDIADWLILTYIYVGNAYKILAANPEGRRPEDNIKMNLK
jgi:hypothetical protein